MFPNKTANLTILGISMVAFLTIGLLRSLRAYTQTIV